MESVTPQADADVIRRSLMRARWSAFMEDNMDEYRTSTAALDRLLALLAEKDAQIDSLRLERQAAQHCRDRDVQSVLDQRDEARAEIERLRMSIAYVVNTQGIYDGVRQYFARVLAGGGSS